MDIQDLNDKFNINKKNVYKLESLGMLDEITNIDGQRSFKDEDINYIMEMLKLMELGIDGEKLVQFYRCKSSQEILLNQARLKVLEELHVLQGKLDCIDFMLYQRKRNI